MNNLNFHKKILAAATFLSVAILAQAQSADDIFIKLSPEIPGPNQSVNISLTSYSVDLDRSQISWSLNGKVSSSGIGRKTFSLTTGGIGAESRVSISVNTEVGSLSRSISIIPGEIDLLWQVTDAYVRPFYKGKALPSPGATIKMVAMPNLGGGEKPSNLVYQWSRNNKAAQADSGYGKNSFTFKNSYFDLTEKISVSASSVSGAAGAENKISVPIASPFVLLYEDRPLEGVRYERALSGFFNLSKEEVRIVAEPYNMTASERSGGNLSYDWKLNNEKSPGALEDPSAIVLRSESGSGLVNLSLVLSNLNKTLQSAGASLNVSFGQR